MVPAMSWAYFADLRLAVHDGAWARISARRPRDVTLAEGWSGLEEEALEEAFGRHSTKDDTFATVLRGEAYTAPETVHDITTVGDTTTVRVCLVLDKSLLDLAYPLATLLQAAREAGAEGSLRLVNDGTYAGEDGVELKLAKGKITKKKLRDSWKIVEALGAEIFGLGMGDEIEAPAEATGKPATRVVINPFTGKPVAPAKKAKAAKAKPLAKKAAPKKKVAKVTPKKKVAKAAPKKKVAKATPKKKVAKAAPKKKVAKVTPKKKVAKVTPKKKAARR